MISKTDIKKCGNCEYWTGMREPIFDRAGIPKNNIIDRMGDCTNENSRNFCGKSREQLRSCKNFSKWTELL